jgi:NAD+ kinase
MTFGIIGNLQKPGVRETVLHLVGLLDRSGTRYCLEDRLAALIGKEYGNRSASMEECAERSDMLVAFGGDGTMLATARLVGSREKPIVGVNLGKLGFLAEISPDAIEEAIGEILAGRFVTEDRLVLQATTSARPGKVYHAVNDVVVDKSRSPRLIDVATFIDGTFAVTYRGDGLIISTPTGSTAYALSNGGPIVTPASNVIGITPISPHTLSGRPLVVPDSSTIRVTVQAPTEEVLFSTDGQVEELLKPPAELMIRKADYSLKLVKRLGISYFDVLRAKLLWGQDARSM